MLYFIPAWYQQNNWCENEQYWYSRRMRTEFDDTVKHIQLFQRSKAYPFQIMLLSFAPNFRHFLHRQSIFHAPYWSCFDAIQEIKSKKVRTFSFHDLNWPEHIEFVYTPFAVIALLNGEKYAQMEFGEDGNLIQVDIYKNEKIQRRNIYDDRGFVSGTIIFAEDKPVYQDYLTDKGVWKIRYFYNDGHVEVNPKYNTYSLNYADKEYVGAFSQLTYECIDRVIYEVFVSYLEMVSDKDFFCVAMHELHTELLKEALKDKRMILSFFGDRYSIRKHTEDMRMIESADYIITDSKENLRRLQGQATKFLTNITDITPFDSRVDFGISQQLSVQKILVPVDGMKEEHLRMLVCQLGKYLPANENARVHLFTRIADYNRKNRILEDVRSILKKAGMPEEWAIEQNNADIFESTSDVRFFVEQCVDELAVSKCLREQRLIIDMRSNPELYLQITGISVGIPQIVHKSTQFVENGKNGMVLRNMDQIPGAVAHYLDSFANWNEAAVYSYELGKRYTTGILIDKWKEVLSFVECDSSITTGK